MVEETHAYGFRNPWRYSTDRETNRIFMGDVGEETGEEVNIVKSGVYFARLMIDGRAVALQRIILVR